MEGVRSVADRYLSDPSGEPYPKRDLFGRMQSYVDDFLSGSDAHSWCVAYWSSWSWEDNPVNANSLIHLFLRRAIFYFCPLIE